MERTLLIIKPCAVQRGLAGKIITRLEERGLKLVAMKMKQLETAEKELARFFEPEDYCDYPSPLLGFIYAKDEL